MSEQVEFEWVAVWISVADEKMSRMIRRALGDDNIGSVELIDADEFPCIARYRFYRWLDEGSRVSLTNQLAAILPPGTRVDWKGIKSVKTSTEASIIVGQSPDA